MRWGKVILIFQAIMTLVIGVAFFTQLTIIGASEISELKAEFISEEGATEEPTGTLKDIKNRFTIAAYVLFIVGLVEIIIIMRLLS